MSSKNKFAILLVRVSTHEQDYQAQIDDLIESAKLFGFNKFKIIESKETGFADIDQKLGLNQLFKFINDNPEYNTVIATEMSRLGRRQSVLQMVKEWLIDNKVQLYIKDSGFWLLNEHGQITQNGEMAFTMYSLFAESEIRAKKDRFIRSRKSLMEKGVSISGKLLFGYKRVKNSLDKNELFPDEINSKIVNEIFNWYLYGFKGNDEPSIKAIALHCIKIGHPKYTHSKRNVNKLLKEEAYTGFKITNNRKKNKKFGLIKNAQEYTTSSSRIKYPQIINQELFDAVQAKLIENMSKKNRESKHVTILSKLLKCPNCGRSLSANYRFNRERPSHSYRCTSRSGTKPCGNQFSGSMLLYDSAIWSVIKHDWIGLSNAIIEFNPDQTIASINNQLENLIKKEDAIIKEVELLKKTMQSIQSFSALDMTSSIEGIIMKLKKRQKDMERINDEKLKLENNLMIIENEYDESKTLIDAISTIEESKELLKQYINKFIHDIQILGHTKQFTTLKIRFKRFGFPAMHIKKPTQKTTYVMIDKRITRDIKLFHRSDYDLVEGAKYEEYIHEMIDEVFTGKVDRIFEIPYVKLKVHQSR